MLDAALAYEALGYSVIPLTPGAKAPPLFLWEQFQRERATADDLALWWSTTPNANIGIVTGAISNLTVIDVDGQVGRASIKEHGLKFPITRIVKTPRGWHIYVQHHPGLHTGAAFLPGIDVRSDGGYVVAPPSVVGGLPYTVLRDNPLVAYAEPPEALLQRTVRNGATALANEPNWVREALAKGSPLHERNATATRLIGFFHSRGVPRDIIAQVMQPYAQHCDPPMDSRELDRTILSVTRYQQHLAVTRIADPPEFTDHGDALTYTWTAHGIAVTIEEPEQSKEGLHAQLSVENITPGEAAPLFGPAKFNLTSIPTRSTLVKYLKDRLALDWGKIIEDVARLTVAHVQEGEPVLDLAAYAHLTQPPWLLKPFLLDNQVMVLFGDGGSGKSLLALAIAETVRTGNKEILGYEPTERRIPLYLDWESSPEDHGLRYAQLCRGANLLPGSMPYIRCDAPITDMTPQLRRLIATEGIGFLVIDSLVAACPDDAETSNTARRVFRALRQLNLPVLAVGHVTKGKTDDTIFGSVFWKNLARNTWLMVAEQERSGLMHVVLDNKKVNSGPLHPRIGRSVQFDAGTIQFFVEEPAVINSARLDDSLDIIRDYLAREGPASADTIAKDNGLKVGTVSHTLTKYKARGLFANEKRGLWNLSSST